MEIEREAEPATIQAETVGKKVLPRAPVSYIRATWPPYVATLPRPLFRAHVRAVERANRRAICEACGRTFRPVRTSQRYCRDACRRRAYRHRHGLRTYPGCVLVGGTSIARLSGPRVRG